MPEMSKLEVPEFKTYEEEAAFWDSLDTANFMEDDGEWFRFETPARRAVRVAILPEVDVIELIADIPDRNLRAGARGTLVHCHSNQAYEVEFTNDEGETLDFLAVRPDQFIVVWRAEMQQWVPVAEQAAALRCPRVCPEARRLHE